MRIAIRVDASKTIGSGHVMRCKTLADELLTRGDEICFVCREHPGNFSEFLRNIGYPVKVLAGISSRSSLGATPEDDAIQTGIALSGYAPDLLIVDHYAIDAAWESALRDRVEHILVIDDLADRQHDCDYLLDQNWFGSSTAGRYAGQAPVQSQNFLGPRYALIPPDFRHLRKNQLSRTGTLLRILIFFGAVDSHGQTAKAMQALSAPEFSDIEVDVVVGTVNPQAQEIVRLAAARPRTVVHSRLPSLAALMSKVDLMLGAGGTTTWERCCLGLPGIVVVASDNQRQFTNVLADEGAHFSLGNAAAVSAADWHEILSSLKSRPEALRTASISARYVTDGKGTLRVAGALHAQTGEIRLRPAEPCDEALLLDWANDPEVRRQAFSKAVISRESHREWFKRKTATPDCLLLIGLDEFDLPIGQVRFDVHDRGALIDISVEPVMRGRGIGAKLLLNAIEILKKRNCADIAIGEVLPDNRPSCEIFRRAGFQLASPGTGRGNSYRFELTLAT